MNIRFKIILRRTGRISAIALVILAGFIFSANSVQSSAEYTEGESPMQKILNSPQWDGKRFKQIIPMVNPSFTQMIRDQFFGNEIRTPRQTLPQETADLTPFISSDTNQVNVTNAGHSSLLINIDGYRVMTDPVFEAKITPVGPSRFNKEIPVDIHALRAIDLVIISHNHYDHLNKYSIQTLDPEVAQFIVPLGVGAQLEKWGVSRSKIAELDWWEEYAFDENLTIVSTPSQHFSGRGLTDRNRTLWTSYAIISKNHRLYFSGDSGYFDGFAEIGAKYGPFDIAFMECGAYNTAWPTVHLFPEETVQASIDVRAQHLYPIHWGTFNLAMHNWFDPMVRAQLAAATRGVSLLTPVLGQTLKHPDALTTTDWWTPFLPVEDIPLTEVTP